MHFTFIPSFLLFFGRFRYLPSQIKYKYLTFSSNNIFRLFCSLLTRHGLRGLSFRYFFTVLFFSLRLFGKTNYSSFYSLDCSAVFDLFFLQKIIHVFTRLRFVFFFFFIN